MVSSLLVHTDHGGYPCAPGGYPGDLCGLAGGAFFLVVSSLLVHTRGAHLSNFMGERKEDILRFLGERRTVLGERGVKCVAKLCVVMQPLMTSVRCKFHMIQHRYNIRFQ